MRGRLGCTLGLGFLQGALLAARLDADAEQQRAAPAAATGSMQPGAPSQHGPVFTTYLPDPPAPALPHGDPGGLALRRRRAAPLLPATQLASARAGSTGEPLGRAEPAAGARDGGAACWREPAAAGDAGQPILLSDSSDEDERGVGGGAPRGGGGGPDSARAGPGGAMDQGSQAASSGHAGLDPSDRPRARRAEELAAAAARRRAGCGAAGLQPDHSSGSGGLPREAAPPPPPPAGEAPLPRAGSHGCASGAARPPLPPQPPAPRPGGSLPAGLQTREPGGAGGLAQTLQQAQPMLAATCAGAAAAAHSQASGEAALGSQGSGGMGGEHSWLVRGCRDCATSLAGMLI